MVSNFEVLMEALYTLENCGNLLAPLKDKIQALRLNLRFITAIFNENESLKFEDGRLKALQIRVQSVCNHKCLYIALLLSTALVKTEDHLWQRTMGGLTSTMLDKVEVLRPDIKEICIIFFESSRSVAKVTSELVMKRVDFCLENIEDLQRYKSDSVFPVKEELVAVQESLRFLKNLLVFSSMRSNKISAVAFLRNLLGFFGSRKIWKLKDLLIHAEIVAENIGYLLCLCFFNDKMEDDEMISWIKLQLLSQKQRINRPELPQVRDVYINTLEVSKSFSFTSLGVEFDLGFLDSLQENLLDLSENNGQTKLALLENMRFLECLVVDETIEEYGVLWQEFLQLCEKKTSLIQEAACVVYSLVCDDENERKDLFYDLLEKFKVAKEEARTIYDQFIPKSLRSNFPTTNSQGYINSLLRNLKRLLLSKADSIAPLKHHIEAVLEELLVLREDFSKYQNQGSEDQELASLWTRFKDVAYLTELLIDSFTAKDGDILWLHKLGLFDVKEEIKTIKERLNLVRRNTANDQRSSLLKKISSIPNQTPLQTSQKEELVVFEYEYEKIVEQLTNGSEGLQVLSIVGMPGTGKTTLAKSIFQSSSVMHDFRVRATYCVSHEQDPKRVLVEIVRDVTGKTSDFSSVEDLELELYQSLKHRKYLIFLDDIWDFGVVKKIKNSLPDDKNRSRILLTSRLDNINIASQDGLVLESFTYHLSLLSDDKSWELLKFKLFGENCCPQELLELGQQIAINCKGLPLTIDIMAGILREIEAKKDCWLEVAQNFLTNVVNDPHGRCRKALEISYNHLPNHLRPCFLYFGAFPEDTIIRTTRLKSLWIAEGFVQIPEENEEKSLEDVAKTYLDELVSRNLIIAYRRGSLGRLKESRIHDLLHDFVRAKAMEEMFMLPVDDSSDFITFTTKDHPWFEQYRLCIHPNYARHFLLSHPLCPRVRSLVSPCERQTISDDGVDISSFSSLRIFYLLYGGIGSSSGSLLHLVHIRFLALGSCPRDVFSKILQGMPCLETLIVNKIEGSIFLNLEDIINMARLRFLRFFRVYYFAFPKIKEEIFEKRRPVCFDNLQHLSWPLHNSGYHIEKFIRIMPNLRRLNLHIISNIPGNWNPCPRLDFLNNLESLTIDMKIVFRTTVIFNFPPCLKKLSLSSFDLPWTDITTLGTLENLEVLKLLTLKSSTDIWDMVEFGQQFPKLKFLVLSYLSFREWNASAEDFPFLEKLEVDSCWYLKELPSCLSDVLTLQQIRLTYCSKSLEDSAEKIKEIHAEHGNELVLEKYR
ncbi:hypothetical protein M9H77_09802 [Catharanthus roseus]|uniref:Uncharacterized protein n=1 Tax=Catharanthus roseus TaxID=4058 RepID=A0ACC0C1Z3_CATRO|nr:hypothetical protein M9H77_09802 [Catharanthus roseus]